MSLLNLMNNPSIGECVAVLGIVVFLTIASAVTLLVLGDKIDELSDKSEKQEKNDERP